MEGSLKIEFKDTDSFIIYYITDQIYEEISEYKSLFKYLNEELSKRYNYSFDGLYDVFVYNKGSVYILEFEYVDSYGDKDFNVTIFLNSKILYEYEDLDLDCCKIYYKGKYYTDINNIKDDIRLFEYGNIIYGKEVDEILNRGISI